MTKRKSVSFSIDEGLYRRFEEFVSEKKYITKSKAINDIIMDAILKKEYLSGKEVSGIIILVYNHHKRKILDKIMDIQHENHDMILSTLHIHLDESNCLEVIVVKGNGNKIEDLRDNLKTIKGVKHCSLNITLSKENE